MRVLFSNRPAKFRSSNAAEVPVTLNCTFKGFLTRAIHCSCPFFFFCNTWNFVLRKTTLKGRRDRCVCNLSAQHRGWAWCKYVHGCMDVKRDRKRHYYGTMRRKLYRWLFAGLSQYVIWNTIGLTKHYIPPVISSEARLTLFINFRAKVHKVLKK